MASGIVRGGGALSAAPLSSCVLAVPEQAQLCRGSESEALSDMHPAMPKTMAIARHARGVRACAIRIVPSTADISVPHADEKGVPHNRIDRQRWSRSQKTPSCIPRPPAALAAIMVSTQLGWPCSLQWMPATVLAKRPPWQESDQGTGMNRQPSFVVIRTQSIILKRLGSLITFAPRHWYSRCSTQCKYCAS
jgi:hypothetical protein